MSARILSYKDSGVNLNANTQWVNRIQSSLSSTHGPQVMGRAGAFAGMFRLHGNGRSAFPMKKPVLVGCADGVGTKVLLGIKAKRLRGLGIDLVAMNVNDLITCGAKPLFFLDYIAVHKLDPKLLSAIIEGIADGCKQAGCALLGGETAEMPDLYRRGDLDLAGFSVGVVDEDRAIDGHRVKPGDVLIGLPSSGIHSNGYSLVRKLISSRRLQLSKRYSELGESLAGAVLTPTNIYVNDVLTVIDDKRLRDGITGMAHITGGGLPENVARTLGPKCDAIIHTDRWEAPPIFPFMERRGVDRNEMYRVFNMGIGYVFVVRQDRADSVIGKLNRRKASPVVIGDIRRGTGKVKLD